MTVSGLRRDTPRPFVVPPTVVGGQPGRLARLRATLGEGTRARRIFRLAALTYVGAIAFVVLMAGMYVFVSPALLVLHKNAIHSFAILTPILLLAAYVGKLDRRTKRDALTLTGLLVIQSTLAHISHVVPILGAFHPVNALVMFWYAIGVAKRTL